MPLPILRFAQMPSCSTSPQRANNGRMYRIDRIAMPHAWAVEIGVDDGKLYHLMIEQQRQKPARGRPPGPTPQRTAQPKRSPEANRLYQKMRRAGIPREEALAEVSRDR